MKKFTFLILSIFILFSCSKDSEKNIISGSWTTDGTVFKIQEELCEYGGWEGLISHSRDTINYETTQKLEDESGNSLEISLNFIETDTSFLFLTKGKAMDLLSPRTIDMSSFPDFYIRVTCEFDGKSYSNFVRDFQQGDKISDDFQIVIEDLNLDFAHDCMDGARNMILEGTFSGTLSNEFDKSDEINIEAGDFRFMLLRY